MFGRRVSGALPNQSAPLLREGPRARDPLLQQNPKRSPSDLLGRRAGEGETRAGLAGGGSTRPVSPRDAENRASPQPPDFCHQEGQPATPGAPHVPSSCTDSGSALCLTIANFRSNCPLCLQADRKQHPRCLHEPPGRRRPRHLPKPAAGGSSQKEKKRRIAAPPLPLGRDLSSRTR